MSVSLPMAFLAGLASFLSPCVLPLVPVYLAVLGGSSPDELGRPNGHGRLILRALAFVVGFSVIFVAMGLSASLIGLILATYRRYLEIVGGILAVVFGLHFSGLIKIPVLMAHKAAHYDPKATGLGPSFLLGMAFSVGWTPCVGPALGAILGLAGTGSTLFSGLILLLAYSIGLGLPFLLVAVFIRYLLPMWSKVSKFARVAQVIGGLLLVMMGVLMIAGFFGRLSGILGGL